MKSSITLFLILLFVPHVINLAFAYQDNYGGDRNYDSDNNEDNYNNGGDNQDHGQEQDDQEVPSLSIPTYLDDAGVDDLLSFIHYNQSCPDVEKIINQKVHEWIKKDRTLAPSLLRLHFHDCAVHGCDGSILLNHEGSERTAEASKTLRGFEIIDDIKTELEKHYCPRTVSCADILTAASRDATVLLGGPEMYWPVQYGRKDGKVSLEADTQSVPMGYENITTLIEFYQSKGLNVLDLVILSGAHTIGRATCESIQDRLYNFQGTGKPDPSLSEMYFNFLSRKCRWASDYTDLDGISPNKFDSQYYRNLEENMGLLYTDQLLYSDPRTRTVVETLAHSPFIFNQQFGVSMVKLGNILDTEVQDDGEIRTVCSTVNSNY